MSKPERIVAIELVFCILGGIGFGGWQGHFGAGLFMTIVLMIAMDGIYAVKAKR